MRDRNITKHHHNTSKSCLKAAKCSVAFSGSSLFSRVTA